MRREEVGWVIVLVRRREAVRVIEQELELGR
jgi:hypothetical protein